MSLIRNSKLVEIANIYAENFVKPRLMKKRFYGNEFEIENSLGKNLIDNILFSMTN